jgi:hypothetical protein
VTELLQARFDEGNKFRAIANFAVLPRGFQSQRMCKVAGGKCGVPKLPEGEVIRNSILDCRSSKPCEVRDFLFVAADVSSRIFRFRLAMKIRAAACRP